RHARDPALLHAGDEDGIALLQPGNALEHHVHRDAAGAQRPPRQIEHPDEEDGDSDQHDRPDSDFLLVGEVHYRPPIRLSPVGTSFALITALSNSRSRNCCTTGSWDATISSAVPTARIFALDKSAIRSATRNAPRTSCVTTTLVTPISCCNRSMSESMTSAFTGSRPDVGSSYSKYTGLPAMAREIPTRLRITLLPTPDGPSNATVSPSATKKSTPSSTTLSTNRLETFFSSMLISRSPG